MADSLPGAPASPPGITPTMSPEQRARYAEAFRRAFTRQCSWCEGLPTSCSCEHGCGSAECPRALEPEPPPPPVPTFRAPAQCANCAAAPATTTRSGYRCCTDCADRADLPAHIREDR